VYFVIVFLIFFTGICISIYLNILLKKCLKANIKSNTILICSIFLFNINSNKTKLTFNSFLIDYFNFLNLNLVFIAMIKKLLNIYNEILFKNIYYNFLYNYCYINYFFLLSINKLRNHIPKNCIINFLSL